MWEQIKQKHVVICWISYFLYLFKKSHLKWNLKLKCRKELWACSLCVIEAFAVNGGYCVGVIVDGNLFCQIWKIKFSFRNQACFRTCAIYFKETKASNSLQIVFLLNLRNQHHRWEIRSHCWIVILQLHNELWKAF